jgi:putative membrane protein
MSLSPVANIDQLKEALKPSPAAQLLHKPLLIAFLICFAVAYVLLCLGIDLPGNWAAGLFMVLAAATTFGALARRLPLQNVLWSGALIATLATIIETVSVTTGIPFGPHIFTDKLGAKIFDILPWSIPLAWFVIVVNCRGVARLIMRPWRKTNYYGFWVMGLTCLLAVLLDFNLEPYATRVRHYWSWQTAGTVLNWYSAPWVNFLGIFVTVLSILAFTTPWLINKLPMKYPTDYHPLIMWQALNLYFSTANALHQTWPALAVGLISAVLVLGFTVRGAR